MNKTVYVVAAVAGVLILGGCSTSEGEPVGIQPFVAAEETTATPEPEVEVPVDYYAGVPTGAGEICDIESLNTVECSKQYPEVAFLNGMTRLAGEPVASMSDAEQIALGLSACEQLRAGATIETVSVVDGGSQFEGLSNNQVVAGGAIPNFCVELDTSGLFG